MAGVLRRIGFPEIALDVVTQAFSQVGFTVLDHQFELFAFAGAPFPIETEPEHSTVLHGYIKASSLSGRHFTTRLSGKS